MSVVIYHNPDCGTSRNVLAILRAAGTDPVVIDYLTEGWTRGQLLGENGGAKVGHGSGGMSLLRAA